MTNAMIFTYVMLVEMTVNYTQINRKLSTALLL